MAWGLRPRVAYHDTYWTASEEDRREYDAFGPWIYTVKAERDMPKRFRAAYDETRDSRFLLKIPRDVERRQAAPGWDLYVAVLAVYDRGLSVIRMTPEGYSTQHLVWADVVALKSYINLLIGRWTLLLRDGTAFTIDYNAVSSDLMDEVTSFVRSRWQRPAEAQAGSGPDVVTVSDHFFRYELNAKRRSGPKPVVPIHFEPRDLACRDERNRRRKSTGVMFLDTPDELIIINRDTPTRRFWETRYASYAIFVPYARLTAYRLIPPPPEHPGRFHELVLRLDRQLIRQACLVVPEQVLMQLMTHGVPEDAEMV
ncbi:MAG: hypothetical protein P4L98_12080 [Ancalomicrobiaceae bacterium]|nr:hypothetical protein [Ancalomicrobiaceae bacterium]